MASMTYLIAGGGVTVEITVTEQDGDLRFDLAVQDGGTIGDLNAIFLDLANDSLTGGMTMTGPDVTETAAKIDGVTKVDNFTNMNGEVIKELGKFDLGVQFGSQGIATDDIQQTSFVLSHATEDLTIADVLGQDCGLRLTSVGEIDGSREDSLKLGGTIDGPVVPDEDPRDEDPNDPSDPGTGEDPTDPGTGGDPTDPGTGGDPTDPGTGGDPTDPGTGGDPTDPGTGGDDPLPPRDEDPNDPSDPGTGEGPTDPTTGEDPTDPGTGGDPLPPRDADPNDPGDGEVIDGEPVGDEFVFTDAPSDPPPLPEDPVFDGSIEPDPRVQEDALLEGGDPMLDAPYLPGDDLLG